MAIQIPTSPNICFYTTWGKQNKWNMHWNEQQTSTNWRLDRIKIWSRRSELMKYIVYLLTIVLPVKQRTVTRLASGTRNDQTVGARKPRLHLSRSVAPNSSDLNPVDNYKLWGTCNSGSIRRRSRMWMNSRSDWLKSELVCSRTLLTLLSTNGETVCVLVFAQRADISNIYCKQLNNWTIAWTVSQSDQNVNQMWFTRVILIKW